PGFDLFDIDIHNCADRIDQHTEQLQIDVRVVDFENDHAGAFADLGLLTAKTHAEIDHRYDSAAQVHHPAQKIWHQGDGCNVAVFDDFPNVFDRQRKQFIGEMKGQVLAQDNFLRAFAFFGAATASG